MLMVIYSLSQASDDTWSIRRAGTTLFSQLRLGPAIQLARETARNEHMRSGRCSRQQPGGSQPGAASHGSRGSQQIDSERNRCRGGLEACRRQAGRRTRQLPVAHAATDPGDVRGRVGEASG